MISVCLYFAPEAAFDYFRLPRFRFILLGLTSKLSPKPDLPKRYLLPTLNFNTVLSTVMLHIIFSWIKHAGVGKGMR